MIVNELLAIIIGVCAFVCMAFAFVGYREQEEGMAIGMSFAFIFLVLIEVGLYFDWDNRTMKAASDFFNTRDEVYKCEGLSPEVCKYKKLIWQKDSTIWQVKLNKIIEK